MGGQNGAMIVIWTIYWRTRGKIGKFYAPNSNQGVL